MITDNIDEHLKWSKEFVKKHGGFNPSKTWKKIVDESHQKIRERIGGVRKINEIKLQKSQGSPSEEEIDTHTGIILSQIPNYFIEYKFNRNIFSNPLINSKDFTNIKVGKHINHWMSKSAIPDKQKDIINKALSEIGKAWARHETQDVTIYANLTTTAKAFALLGHYGPDRESCFRNPVGNQGDKYALGAQPNSFILLITKEPTEELEEDEKILARLWGIANDDFSQFDIYNYYQRPYQNIGNIYSAVDSILSDIAQYKLERIPSKSSVSGVYNNKTNAWSLGKSVKEIITNNIRIYRENFRFVSCYYCGDFDLSSGMTQISNKYVCEDCCKEGKVKTCSVTGAKIIECADAILLDGSKGIIDMSLVANGRFVPILEGQQYIYYDKSQTFRDGKGSYHLIKDKNNFDHCKYCMKLWPKNSFDGLNHCPNCSPFKKESLYNDLIEYGKYYKNRQCNTSNTTFTIS